MIKYVYILRLLHNEASNLCTYVQYERVYALREKQKYGTIPCKNPIFKLTI